MHEIFNKAVAILPSVRWYNNAVVFYNVDNKSVITRSDVSETFIERTFGEKDTIVILQAKNNMLSVKQIIVPKVSLVLRKIAVRGTQFTYYLSVDPEKEYHSLVYENLQDAGNLNEYDNDQYIADLLQELEVQADNVFIEP